jgi:hypothetical protein
MRGGVQRKLKLSTQSIDAEHGRLLPRLLQAIRQVLIRVTIPLHRTKTSAVVLQSFDDAVEFLGINLDFHGAAPAF